MAVAVVALFLAGLGSGLLVGWVAGGRRLPVSPQDRPWPPWRPAGELELAEQCRILIEACQAGAARLRAIDPALWERMTDALAAAGASEDLG